MSADGTDTAAAPAAAPAPAGSTILTSGIPAAPPPEPGSADATIAAVMDGPPEWAPAKFWDPQSKSVRVEDLAKSYINLERLQSREKIPLPQSSEDREGWDRWYAASGRPEAPDKYEFQRPDKLPDGMDYDADTETHYRTLAHQYGLNKQQAKGIYDGFVKTQIDRHASWHTHQQQAKAQVQADLMREHGNQYEGALAMAKAAMAKYADPEYIRMLEETGRGNDPREIRAWIRVGKEMAGSTILKGKAPPSMTPVDANRAISEFNEKHKEALGDRSHPRHKWAVDERSKLFEMAYPDGPV